MRELNVLLIEIQRKSVYNYYGRKIGFVILYENNEELYDIEYSELIRKIVVSLNITSAAFKVCNGFNACIQRWHLNIEAAHFQLEPDGTKVLLY